MTGRKHVLCLLTLAGIVAALATSAQAVPITVTNAQFEMGAGTNPCTESGWYNDAQKNGGTDTSNYLTGWTLVVPTYRFSGRWNPSDSNYVGATDGDGTADPSPMSGQVADMHWGSGGTAATAYIRSTSTVTTIQAGKDYILTVGVGSPLGTNMNQVLWYQVNLKANGVTVAGGVNITPPARGSWTDASVTLSKETIAASGLAGQALTIELAGRAGQYTHIDFDNVRLNEVPEPASMSVLALGGIALLARKRRS